MSKVYVVVEYGGEWEDSWESINVVCKSIESAENVKHLIELEHLPPKLIDANTWDDMVDSVWDETDVDDVDLLDFLLSKFSDKYPEEEITKAYSYYQSNYDWAGVYIKESNLID